MPFPHRSHSEQTPLYPSTHCTAETFPQLGEAGGCHKHRYCSVTSQAVRDSHLLSPSFTDAPDKQARLPFVPLSWRLAPRLLQAVPWAVFLRLRWRWGRNQAVQTDADKLIEGTWTDQNCSCQTGKGAGGARHKARVATPAGGLPSPSRTARLVAGVSAGSDVWIPPALPSSERRR